MSRPHIEFIPAQVIPWQRGLYGGARPGVETRLLSLDGETGAASLMLRYPPGWSQPAPEYVEADEEFLVLDGQIEINGQVYGLHCYGHFPARYQRHSVRSPKGAVVLTFFSAEPKTMAGSPATPMSHPERLVRFIDARAMSGEEGVQKDLFPTLKPSPGSHATVHKRLKTDPVTGEVTWIVAVRGGRMTAQTEIHPVVEEEFCLSGDMVGPHGNMRPGAYFWRPPGIQHGPFGSHTGALHFIRGLGGPYTTIVSPSDTAFDWDTPYRPILPPQYQEYARSYVDKDLNY